MRRYVRDSSTIDTLEQNNAHRSWFHGCRQKIISLAALPVASLSSLFFPRLVISRGPSLVPQRALSNGPDSAAGGRGDGGSSGRKDASTGGQKGVGGAAGEEARANQPAGRGRGAFSQYLRTHEVRQRLGEPPAPSFA